ncbi:HEAT repeat-containing protein [Besnoitia besnoiti]|uniref:HEAT repeat-containing protein n=1 Tax=Besnoitia besnoiti TaxID=94643 RepID=A0A2A9M2D2_BESBE|nr:HEAT repeat-containing protein [Besnoitia besnoiti]PFH32145.1 HEAT repeat-containing protein [Besnoitia besnoiti]
MSLAPFVASTGPLLDRASAGMRALISIVSKNECQYFEEGHFNASQVKKELQDASVEAKVTAMKRLLAAHASGADVSPLLPDVVKAIAVPDLELKRLVYLFLVQHAEGNRDLALLSINSFQKDLSDRNHIVRAAALKALASIRLLEVVQLLVISLKRAAADSSPFVRRTAAQCVVKVFALDQDQFEDLKNIVLTLLADVEVSVVGAALVAFRELCLRHSYLLFHGDEDHPDDRDEEYLKCSYTPTEGRDLRSGTPGTAVGVASGGCEGRFKESQEVRAQAAALALLHRHYRRLQKCLPQFESFAQVVAVDLFLRYCRLYFSDPVERFRHPGAGVAHRGSDAAERNNENGRRAPAVQGSLSNVEGSAEAPVTIERLTEDSPGNPTPADLRLFLTNLQLLLHSESPDVVVAATAALFYLIPSSPAAWQAAVHPMLRCMHTCASDVHEPLLHTISVLASAAPSLFVPHVRSFFLRFTDSPPVRQAKLQVLRSLVASASPQDTPGGAVSPLALLMLPELRTYIHWPGDQALLSSSFRFLTFLALRFPPVQAACMQIFVQLLDAPSAALAAEAVLALQTLLQRQLEQQRESSARSGQLGRLLLQLVSQLPRVHAPAARASVVWIVGQYQREVGWVAADFLRQLVGEFKAEAEEVKLQILLLALKVWAFHWLNKTGLAHAVDDDAVRERGVAAARGTPAAEEGHGLRSDKGEKPTGCVGDQRQEEEVHQSSRDFSGAEGSCRGAQKRDVCDETGDAPHGQATSQLLPMPTEEESAEAFPRLDGMLKYICEVASFDRSYDVRDMARLYFTLSRLALSTERAAPQRSGVRDPGKNGIKREDFADGESSAEASVASGAALSSLEGLSGLGGDSLKRGAPVASMQQFAGVCMRFLAAAPGDKTQRKADSRSHVASTCAASTPVAAFAHSQNRADEYAGRAVGCDAPDTRREPVFALGSLSDMMSERMAGYASLPAFAAEDSADELRFVETEERRALVIGPPGTERRPGGGLSSQKELKSISSDDVVVRRNAAALMGREAVVKAAPTPLDLDTFYNDLGGLAGDRAGLEALRAAQPLQQSWREAAGGSVAAEAERGSESADLWQMFGNAADSGSRAGFGGVEAVFQQGRHPAAACGPKTAGCGGGVAVAGEDDESEDEDQEWRAAAVGEKEVCDGSCGVGAEGAGVEREEESDWKFMPPGR